MILKIPARDRAGRHNAQGTKSRSWVRSVTARVFVLAFAVLASCEARAERIVSVGVDGTQFKVTLDSGRVLDSPALRGAVLDVAMPGGWRQRIRIADVQKDFNDPDGDVVLHHILVASPSDGWAELCRPDAQGATWAFPLRGQWDREGQRTSEIGLTLTCTSGALGKCVRFGYKPWKADPGGFGLASYHAACVHAVRADYCGGGHATTRDGQLIDIFDGLNIQQRDPVGLTRDMPFEAAFSPTGAVCVAHTRVPEQMTLAALGATCPRLAGRLGQKACIEGDSFAGRYGQALIFIRSPEGERGHEPSQVEAPALDRPGSPVGQTLSTDGD